MAAAGGGGGLTSGRWGESRTTVGPMRRLSRTRGPGPAVARLVSEGGRQEEGREREVGGWVGGTLE